MRHLLAALCLALTATPLAAQRSSELTELQPGARIRLAAPGIVAGRYVGTILTRASDTLTIGSPTGAPVAVPIARITRLEVSRGKSRTLGALRGIKWGTPIGLAFGLVTVGEFEDCGSSCTGDEVAGTKAGWMLFSAFSGALWGAGIGAIVGREAWDDFQLAPRPSVGLRREGLTLGLQLSIR